MQAQIIVLSGPQGSGKTTTCRQLAELARQRGLDCAGVLSLARFDGARKVGIDLLNLRSGERRPLAERIEDSVSPHAEVVDGKFRSATVLETESYRFREESLARGAAVLETATPCDLLIVDELGPLELERGQGWAGALDTLRAGRFRLAVVVVRPGLLAALHRAMRGRTVQVFTLPAPPGTDLPTAILSFLDDTAFPQPALGRIGRCSRA